MPHLIVVRDVLRGGREIHDLALGVRLSHELMRLYPEGFLTPWRIYKGEVIEDCEIAAASMTRALVEDVDYVLVIRPAGPLFAGVVWQQIFWAMAISLAIGVLTYFLTPKPKKSTSEENKESPNNQIAGQSNQLRAGARVPDILGKVRAYPDLLLPPLEVWTKRKQEITQFFVIGVGEYILEDPKLGETPILSMAGVSPPTVYPPGSLEVPQMKCIRISPEVNQLSLVTQNESAIIVTGASFTAPNTMTLPTHLAVVVGDFISISGSLNAKVFSVEAVPLITQVAPPFVYTLGGPAVINEPSANPTIAILQELFELACYILAPFGTPVATLWNLSTLPVIGNVVELDSTGSGGSIVWLGVVTSAGSFYEGGEGFYTITMNDLNGNPIIFANPGGAQYCRYTEWSTEPAEEDEEDPAPAEENEFSDWYTVPMQDPDEIWIDVGFPQGLVQYYQGKRRDMGVGITAEFRRLGATDAQDSRGYGHTESTTGAMRWTHLVTTAQLTGLPAGSGYIQVRLRRTTPFLPDDDDHQYVQETNWDRLAGIRYIKPRVYPDVTLAGMGLVNTRSAASIGENSFNAIITRVLPSWTGSGWSAKAPTEKWADNLVARMKAADGANKLDAEIDLAGIYAIQAQLNAMDGGDQGKISMTLDQQQDIDAELQSIAQLVRGTVYRIGRKLFVTRDQGGKIPLALFTGRSKSAAGEQVNIAFKNDSEHDAVTVQWFDRANGWKLRDYQYPAGTPLNEFRVTPPFANWAQAWRRSRFEWNRIRLRRESLNMQATEEARLLHIGDVINVADDVSNLAQSAGEIIAVGLDGVTLELDIAVNLSAGGYAIMLRAQNGRDLDTIPITAGADARHVVLSRAPMFAIKGRDDHLGTIYAVYRTANAVVRPWLVTSLDPQDTYTRVQAANWREDVYAGDTAPLDPPPNLIPATRGPGELPTPNR